MKFRGGMNELMRQASRMQRKIEKRREELALEQLEAGAGNDQVKAVATGNAEIVRITIDPALLEAERTFRPGDRVLEHRAVQEGRRMNRREQEALGQALQGREGPLGVPGAQEALELQLRLPLEQGHPLLVGDDPHTHQGLTEA